MLLASGAIHADAPKFRPQTAGIVEAGNLRFVQKALGCRIAAPEQSCAHFVVGVPGNNFCVLFCIGPAFTVFTDAPVVPNVPPLPTKQFLTMDPAAAVSAKADGSSSATPSCTPTRRAEGNDQFIGRGSYGRQEVPNTEARPHSHPEDRHRLRKKSRPSKASRGPPPPPRISLLHVL